MRMFERDYGVSLKLLDPLFYLRFPFPGLPVSFVTPIPSRYRLDFILKDRICGGPSMLYLFLHWKKMRYRQRHIFTFEQCEMRLQNGIKLIVRAPADKTRGFHPALC